MTALRRRLTRCVLPAILALGAAPIVAAPSQAAEDDTRLYLVTLQGPGTTSNGVRGVTMRVDALATQDSTLASVDAGDPVYRWTHALNGYAVHLDAEQAADLARDPAVVSVEPDSRRKLAGMPGGGSPLPGSPYAATRGGRGTVIGFIDSGLAPESPLFAASRSLGARPRGFTGDCEQATGWPASACNGKVVAARHFVAGFGEDRLASGASLSARDDNGHGTQVTSIAAGNADVSMDVRGRGHGTFSGVAPLARIGVYKACWTAPNPAEDGCSTADLVAAVDRAVADGVDVLNLAVSGAKGYDTLSRALLGAAESDVVVVAAAGSGRTVAHPEPWVTTVGATSGTSYAGQVRLPGGPTLTGAMFSDREVGPARIVRAEDAVAPGARTAAARLCKPGSLDDRLVTDRIVICHRGAIGRVDKSLAVKRAGGAAMVLVNSERRSGVSADLHYVPTVHLDQADGRRLLRWLRGHQTARVRLAAMGESDQPAHVLPGSASGDPATTVLKPDLVAPGAGQLGAVPPALRGTRWDFLTGTSAATAQVSGLAAVLRGRTDWSAARVRSLLVTSAEPLRARALRRGSGEAVRGIRPGLAFDVAPGDYRRFVEGHVGRGLNMASVMLSRSNDVATRTVTNVSGRTRTWSAGVRGFSANSVRVEPAALTLRPGQSARFRVVVDGADARPLEDGVVVWTAPGTTPVRVPVVLSR